MRPFPPVVAARYRELLADSRWNAEVPLVAGAALGFGALVQIVRAMTDTDPRVPFALLLGLATTLPVALARLHVLAAAALVTVGTLLTVGGELTLTAAALVAQCVVLYLAGRQLPRKIALLLLLPVALASLLVVGNGLPGEPVAALWLLAVAMLGTGAGIARRGRAEAVERAVTQEAMRHSRLEHAVRGERARIARELHDVVAHHISMIVVQAETARLTTPAMPADGARHLVAIGDTARDALTEMRRLLGVLREDANPEPDRAPQPGLSQLNQLIDGARVSAAVSTRLVVRGRVRPLDPGIELTAYRIVQEALTNARRYASGAAVDVELAYSEETLRLRVRDNGPGPSGSGGTPGHGLLGMRERAGMLGGTLRTGPATPTGFLVEAVLPTASGGPA
ncbi:sensor histidine kinase [Virgisporangium aurantiacum]|uniref:sensor histidine kinase n=1 Tax=Virgisporangium aurantiacum TaxID=175570 RepID=UPI001EF36422|nr:histidine kinase [Virgisporangium aurantiacum]